MIISDQDYNLSKTEAMKALLNGNIIATKSPRFRYEKYSTNPQCRLMKAIEIGYSGEDQYMLGEKNGIEICYKRSSNDDQISAWYDEELDSEPCGSFNKYRIVNG